VRISRLPAVATLLALAGCSAPAGTPLAEPESPTGFVLVSLSGLRHEVLDSRPDGGPAPFLGSLAARSRSYETAFSASPDTLVSHVSLLSGLLPPEHGVAPYSGVLAAEIPVLPERFAAAGFRTAAFTDGGYLTSTWGFDRGFDEFAPRRAETEASPFERARRFLATVGDDPFFLLVQSHDLDLPVVAAPNQPGVPAIDVGAVNAGFLELTPALVAAAAESWRHAVERVDRELERLFTHLDHTPLAARTVVVVTSDHGAELGEHGRLGHTQVYPQSTRVPLLMVGPGIEPTRVSSLVQTTQVGPTLERMAGLAGVGPAGLPSSPTLEGRGWAYAAAPGRQAQETLVRDDDDGLWQAVSTRLRGEHDGTWVTRSVTFDTSDPILEFALVSFHVPRSIGVSVDGAELDTVSARTDWRAHRLVLGSESRRRRVTLATEDCTSPAAVGAGADPRCLSFKVRGLELERFELFELESDPGAGRDLSYADPGRAGRLLALLAGHPWSPAPEPGRTRPTASDLEPLERRSELPEPPHAR
jgi:hypothetical protein